MYLHGGNRILSRHGVAKATKLVLRDIPDTHTETLADATQLLRMDLRKPLYGASNYRLTAIICTCHETVDTGMYVGLPLSAAAG